MGLTKYKLGSLIELSGERNTDGFYGIDDVRGINNMKLMMQSKADLNGRDLTKFQIVYPGEFVFNHRTSRNGSKFSITYNYDSNPHIFTEDYVVFHIKNDCSGIILKEWLYLYFCRSEFDRFVITNSWGSSTEFYNWSDICDIELTLPTIEQQIKYVNLYLALKINLSAYQGKVEDLKIVCDGYIERLRQQMPSLKIGDYIVCTDRKTNNPNLAIKGISNQRCFIDSDNRTEGVNKERYLMIEPREFGYSPIHINDGSIAFNDSNDSYLLSPIYKTFRIKDESILYPEYLC